MTTTPDVLSVLFRTEAHLTSLLTSSTAALAPADQMHLRLALADLQSLSGPLFAEHRARLDEAMTSQVATVPAA